MLKLYTKEKIDMTKYERRTKGGEIRKAQPKAYKVIGFGKRDAFSGSTPEELIITLQEDAKVIKHKNTLTVRGWVNIISGKLHPKMLEDIACFHLAYVKRVKNSRPLHNKRR